jgi:MFS transporter, DHA2 family, multidrug resistance protein
MQCALEEGPRYQWFEDSGVQIATMLSVIGLVVFLERSFYSSMPVVKLNTFRNPTFAMACAFNLVIGIGIYGSTYLMPVFLARVRDFSSFDIGTTVFVTGMFMGIGAPIAARLSTRIDPRIVISVGLVLFSGGLWMLRGITPDWGYGQLFLPQAVRGFAVLLCIVPTVNMALRGLTGMDLRYGSGLFNLMRNLGGAIGIALVDTALQDGGRWHALRIGEALGARPNHATDTVLALATRMGSITPDSAQATQMARALVVRVAGHQALAQAFQDIFAVMACVFLAALMIVPFCRPKRVAGLVEAH